MTPRLAELLAQLEALVSAIRAEHEAQGEALPASAKPEAHRIVQATLPGFQAPQKAFRKTQHRFRVIAVETIPASDVLPEYAALTQQCRHCDCRRRRANTGRLQGAHDSYSINGQTWSAVSPPCVRKR